MDNNVTNGLTEPFYFQTGVSNSAQNEQYRLRKSNVYSGTWHHGVLVMDSQNLKLFFDGELIKDSTFSSTFHTNSNDILIGQYWLTTYPERDWTGDIDDIGIWNRALNAQEINQIYSNYSYHWSPSGKTTSSITVQLPPTQ